MIERLRTATMTVLALAITSTFNTFPARAGMVEIKQNQLVVDGQPQPQLFGAEIQYFRLRGGEGRNIPRARVIELWNKALDRAVEAKMNTVGFYIPWDFHEYAEGKFDFDGTVDEDGDGNADYPSRDVRTWIKLVEAKGLKNLHVRPGPFINAEWGFLGFGAVPLWFHQKFPNSHSLNPKGQRSLLNSYTDPDFRRYSKRWLETVYQEVLKPYIGPGRLVTFLQIDNETNLMWQSAFNHDYSPRSQALYRSFLKLRYDNTLAKVNIAHRRAWREWNEIKPPTVPNANIFEDQDWYRFQDETMYQYLRWIRSVWEAMGVREPAVLFTLAESYNAAEHGVLPHYRLRNMPGQTGMMTVNLYPKTYETDDITLMNLPFKTDHDVKAAESANDFYLGSRQEWVMGPEIQAGWWRGTHVSLESRRQTYLSTLGHGMKALYLYYFNEGDNWQSTWAKDQILPYFTTLRKDPRYKNTPDNQLSAQFWAELNEIVANNLFVGWDAWWVLKQGGTQPKTLYFDAPIGADGEPRAPYASVKEFGERVIAPYGRFLGSAVEMTDEVCMIKDSNQHAPSTVSGVSSRIVNSDWAGGLLALLFHAGINPRIHHWDINPKSDLLSCKLVVYQDNGFATPELAQWLKSVLARGGGVLNFIDDGLTRQLLGRAPTSNPGCVRIPGQPMEVDGYRCAVGTGYVYQARVPIHDVFNTDFYARVHDAPARRAVMEGVLRDLKIRGRVQIKGGADRVVAYARMSQDAERYWVTVKSGRLDAHAGAIQLSVKRPNSMYEVTEVFTRASVRMRGSDLYQLGWGYSLGPNGSTAYYVEPIKEPLL